MPGVSTGKTFPQGQVFSCGVFVIYPALKATSKNGDYSYTNVNAGFSLKEFFSFLGVCSLDVFFGQQFFHFPIDLYQLKHPGIFDSKFV